MTMTRMVWPSDSPDMFQFERMVRLAEVADPSWKPPERFAYTVDIFNDGDGVHYIYDFEKKLTQLKNHGRELYDSLPKMAKLLYYLHAMTGGVDYARTALHQLDRQHEHHNDTLQLSDAEEESLESDLEDVEELLDELEDAIGHAVIRVRSFCGPPNQKDAALRYLEREAEEDAAAAAEAAQPIDPTERRERLNEALGDRTRRIDLDEEEDEDEDGDE